MLITTGQDEAFLTFEGQHSKVTPVKRGWKIAIRALASLLIALLAFTALALNWLGLGINEIKLLPALPNLLGCSQPQKYFVAFTTSAEARALGGLIGQYAVIETDCASLKVLDVGTNAQLVHSDVFLRAQEKYPDIFLGKNTEWVNSTLFPDGELVGSMWLEAYSQQFGQKLDGAIGVDLPLLVDLSVLADFNFKDIAGNTLSTRSEILNYLLNGIYFDYPVDNIKRKALQLDLSRQMVNSIEQLASKKIEVLKLFSQTIAENRIYVYKPGVSNNPLYKKGSLFYNMDSDSKLILTGANNLSGSKFDFYSTFDYQLTSCKDNSYRIKMSIKNVASASTDFPNYVDNRLERNPAKGAGTLTQLMAILPKGSSIPIWKGPADWSAETLELEDGKIVVSAVGVVQAGQSYNNFFHMQGPRSMKLLSWGQMLKTAPKSKTCQLPVQ